MADNSNGGQYQTSDSMQTTDGNSSITGSVAPTSSGQMPPQPPQTVASTPNGQMPPQPDNSPQAQQTTSQAPQAPASAQTPKPQAQAQPAPQPQTFTQKFLSRAREISDELVGGDPYQTKIDPNTGETTRIRQPLSPRAISMSLVLEALKGGIAGAGEHGPAAIGQAAQAGMKQGEQIAQQRQDAQAKQDEQAQTDLRNRQQAITNTLQTRQLAQTLGRQSLEQAKASVEADSAEWQAHQADQSSIIGQGLSHDDAYATFNKLPPGSAQVLITGARPRVDPKTGKAVFQNANGQIVDENTPGAYQAPDFTYAVVKPTAKHSITDNDGNLTPEVQDNIKYGFQQIPKDANGKYPPNYQVDGVAYQAGTRGTQIAKALQTQINQQRAEIGLKPYDISKDLADDSTARQAMLIYNGVLGTTNGNHQKAYEAVLANPQTASAAGTLQNWFGGAEGARHLDNMRAQQDFDTDTLNGDRPIVTRDDAQRAVASKNPQVAAAGKAAFSRMDKEDADQASRKAYATESAHVWGEKQIATLKADLALKGMGEGNLDALAQPAVRNSSGVLVHQAYFDSLPRDLQAQLWGMAAGRDEGPNTRTKAGAAIDRQLQAAFPEYDKTKYNTYQHVAKDFVDGKKGDGIAALNRLMDHGADAFDNATMGATLPGISAIERGLGNDQANGYNSAIDGFSEEVAKAVKGGVVTGEEGAKWINNLKGGNPASAKSRVRSVLPLVKGAIDAQQALLDKASPIGVAPLRVFNPVQAQKYERISGNSADTQGSPATHVNTPAYVQQTKDGKWGQLPNGTWQQKTQ